MSAVCSECGRAGGELRSLPARNQAGNFSAVAVCETCVVPAVGKLRDILRRATADEDDMDAEMEMLLLIAFLRSSGLDIEDEHRGGREGMDGVRFGLSTLLDLLERQLLCSGCGKPGPESRMHVIPWFEGGARQYVTTFRCGECVRSALAETIAHLGDSDGPHELDSLGHILVQHGIHVHEWLRGDPPEVVRPILLQIVKMIEAGKMKLSLGATTRMPVA